MASFFKFFLLLLFKEFRESISFQFKNILKK